jgi:hypothetical protein
MSDSTHKAPRSNFRVATDSNEFYIPHGTNKMINEKYKEWKKIREGLSSSTTHIKFYPRSHKI